MQKKKGKSISFDAMVKFFMQYYNIPTRKDIDSLVARMESLERVIVDALAHSQGAGGSRRLAGSRGTGRTRAAHSAEDLVLAAIAAHPEGAGFSQIQDRTGFEDKKVRNILYRLHKAGKIRRIRRGRYTTSESGNG